MEDHEEADYPADTGPFTGEDIRSFREKRPEVIAHKRRLELAEHAAHLSQYVLENVRPHEYCLLRSMVMNLLPGR